MCGSIISRLNYDVVIIDTFHKNSQKVYFFLCIELMTFLQPPLLTEYNFYEYDTQRSSFHDYDVSMCFNVGYKADFLLVFPGNYRSLVFKNIVVSWVIFSSFVHLVYGVANIYRTMQWSKGGIVLIYIVSLTCGFR